MIVRLIICRLLLIIAIHKPPIVTGFDNQIRSHSSNQYSTELPAIKQEVFTFSRNNSFLQIDSTNAWPPYITRTLSFKFRTDRPNGLLFFHTVDSAPEGYSIYEFYTKLEGGTLKIIHEFGSSSDEFTIGKGLNDNEWHEVNLTAEANRFKLKIVIDGQLGSIFNLLDFAKKHPYSYQPYSENIKSIIFFGGLDSANHLSHLHHLSPRFIGCIGYINFYHENILFIKPPRIQSYGLRKGCQNVCLSSSICLSGAPCINHYTHATCDCFTTQSEDDWCSSDRTSITLRGSSFITHKAFNWTERSEALFNRISVHFKTLFDTSIILHAYGLQPRFNRITLMLVKGQIRFEVDFGEGALEILPKSDPVNDNKWHNVTVIHVRNQVFLTLDGKEYRLNIAGPLYYMHLEPYIYVGGLSRSLAERLNISTNVFKSKFAGCLKSVYFNDADILYELKRNSPSTRFIGLFSPTFGCADNFSSIPMTFQTSWSYLNITRQPKSRFNLSMEFKTNQTSVVLASGSLAIKNRTDYGWILYIHEKLPQISIIHHGNQVEPQLIRNNVNTKDATSNYEIGRWQTIDFRAADNKLIISLNKNLGETLVFANDLMFHQNVIVGALNTTFANSSQFGYGIMGCIQNLLIDYKYIDPRIVVNDKSLHSGKISLDECKLVNPCDYPAACEHNGRCTVNKQGEADCDCSGTGYAGKTCHFALYKRTCEEYFLIGHRKNATYMVDIDRNGPLPPANVDCTMSSQRKETTIRHNLPVEFIVRKSGISDYYIDVQYREFTDEMLIALISHTKGCTQEVKYGCKKAPFGLSRDTWMISAAGMQVDSLGSELSGRCPCSTGMSCRNRALHCNCDDASELEDEDSGILSDPSELAIRRIYFKQPSNLTDESEGRLTLSPLRCIDLKTQEHNITFKTRDSYLKLEGWTKGDLAFSFKTTVARGIILYQAPLYSHHGYFRVSVISENEMLFEYSVNQEPKQSVVISQRKLNNGEWHQVWVDYESRHMRFTVNLDSFMIDLDIGEEFDQFEGHLYIGGAPRSVLKDSSLYGFLGCFRGLIIDDAIIPLKVTGMEPNVQNMCQESCKPSPCENGGKCIEKWGNYECKCANPYAQKGKNCEIDANNNTITIASDNSFIHMLIYNQKTHPILLNDILISFKTYETQGLLLYANDHLNNFIMLHINQSSVVLTFNSRRSIVNGAVDIGSKLNDGSVVQIRIVRQLNQTLLEVYTNCLTDCVQHSISIKTPLNLLTEYYHTPWQSGSHLELVHPIRSFIALPSHTQFFIGGVDPIVNHSLPAFIGCISGLSINKVPFDLEDLLNGSNKNLTTIKGDITPKCSRKCDKKPCENNGKCREDIREKSLKGVTCSCEKTSYRGRFCEQDVGVRFDGSSVLLYNLSSYSDSPLDTLLVEFTFAAQPESYSFMSKIKRLIMVLYYDNRSFSVALLSSGGVQFQEENGTGKGWRKIIQPPQQNYADGLRHWVVYSRVKDNMTFQIDNLNYNRVPPSEIPSKEKNFPEYYLKVGGSLEVTEHLKEFKTYIGCISNLRMSFGVNLEHVINPIESAFDGDRNVDVMQSGSNIWQGIKQQRCSRFKILTRFENMHNLENMPSAAKWSPSEPVKQKLLTVKTAKSPMDPDSQEFYLIIFCAVFLTIVLGSIFVYMCKLQKVYELNKFRHDTPFFNSHRNNASSVPYSRVYQDERPAAAARLLQYQPGKQIKKGEFHQLQEASRVDQDYERSAISNLKIVNIAGER